MRDITVNLITAFGRGETLARALLAQNFSVNVLDFTPAFPKEYRRGPGPFPIALKEYMPEQKEFLAELGRLDRGLAFWLPEGPLELNGPMAPFYKNSRGDFQNLALEQQDADFKIDWLRRFLLQWASPYHQEAWDTGGASGSGFPWKEELGLIPSYDEVQVMSFQQMHRALQPVMACTAIEDVQFEGSRLKEIVVTAGQAMALKAEQWVWYLSSRESEILNATVAKRIFSKGIWRPEWSWVSFSAQCEHGPWSEGLPTHTLFMGDICLPWTHANFAVIRRLDPEGFRVWCKVPSKAIGDEEQRQSWAMALQKALNQRLPQAKWSLQAEEWGICPNSPVFDPSHREWGVPAWKNWDWIAPERLSRVDFSCRLEREAKSFERLQLWRQDFLKKQGAHRDHTLHAP